MNDVQELVTRADEVAPEFAATSAAERRALLRGIADVMDAGADELVTIAGEETALPEARLRGELARTTWQLRKFGDAVVEGSYLEAVVDHADPSDVPPRPDLRRMLRPLGPVAMFAASNFPFAFSVAGGDTASALAAGCPVIVKAHSGHPRLSRRTAELVSAAVEAAGLPAGVFGLVEGFEQGLALVDAEPIEAVSFTGSVAGGRALLDRCTARPRPIPFFGELGSLNPVVVTAAADAARGDELAAGLAGSFQLGAGQFCTKPGLVLVPQGSRLIQELPAQVAEEEPTMLTERIAEGFATGRAAATAVDGVEVLAGGGGATAPTLLATDASVLLANAEVLLEEVFGPLTLLVRYADAAERESVLAELPGSLTATLHAEDSDDIDGLVDRLGRLAGRVLFAGWPTGVAVSWAQHHGGPWPATNTQHTSVGMTSIRRFLRPVAYQDAPERALPPELRDDNPLGIPRRVDGRLVPGA
ncbi:aldehyde dehydrogenase (NADP(+)) [Homoserinibacter sp. GY 40078]|uniref:aldehyde dehydrogenase (NADP(+)) n=1 Tax=Homoserinibacter sp. GY 40078 TaxID=2603275 RepID=UPI0011C9B7C6|nr:aldehyde dehydrogenase (NADP(+)) [Homoserinibacter sp. GY 40078]TXK19022.1 aldehyde dehydrogenase (NADP(+)) [Homoserinibacter sp. GY 40078]